MVVLGLFFGVAKRVRDCKGGVSQCGEQRSTVAERSPVKPDPHGNAQKCINKCFWSWVCFIIFKLLIFL